MMQYKYHCYIPAEQGHNGLPFNPCSLLDLSLLKLAAGQRWSGGSGDREILAVMLGGTATFTVGDAKFPSVGGRANVFAGKPHSVRTVPMLRDLGH
jgi:5-deoxy-glucuronate isomerase